MSYTEKIKTVLGAFIGIIIILLILGSVLGFSMIGSVGVSEVAIIVDPLTGNIVGTVTGPRFFIKMPWQYYVKISTSVESLDMWTDIKTGQRGEWPAIVCLTNDGLEVYVDITVRWRVDPERATELYVNYPDLNWENKALVPLLRETVRNIVSNYTAIETIEKRAEISQKITQSFIISIKNERSLAGAISVEGIDLRNIELPPNFKNAVEQKLAEQQQKIAAQFKRERILIEANATATSKILEALGEAKAKLIAANATALSIHKILEVAGNNTDIAEIYLTYTLLKELVSQGGNVYIIVASGGKEGGIQVVPIPMGKG
ncbi:MAG: prohibitin family protein [Thermoproteales archaeon]|nr:prohibitin family protein [Thermoproteales archaeon]